MRGILPPFRGEGLLLQGLDVYVDGVDGGVRRAYCEVYGSAGDGLKDETERQLRALRAEGERRARVLRVLAGNICVVDANLQRGARRRRRFGNIASHTKQTRRSVSARGSRVESVRAKISG